MGILSNKRRMYSAIGSSDVEADQEQSDLQQTKPLKWSISKPQRYVAAEQLYKLLKNYNN